MTGSENNWSARTPMFLGLLGVAVLVGGFGSWAVFANIAGAIVASGQVEVEQNRQIVQHQDGGLVEDLSVKEGDIVDQGTTLVRLDATLLESRFAVAQGQLYEMLARKARLEAERDGAEAITFPEDLVAAAASDEEAADLMRGQEALHATRQETLEQEVERLNRRTLQIQNQVEGIEAQQVALQTQLELIEEELEGQQSLLDKGLTDASRVLGLRREAARLAGTVGELAASRSEALGRITEIEIEILRLKTVRREEAITRLRDLQFNEIEVREEARELAERLSRLEVRAPVAGVVYGMTVFGPGAVIRPAEPVLYVVPQDRPLVITAQIETIHVDQVFVGQEVILRFSAFDAREAPELTGIVTQISADAFTEERSGRTFYRAELRLKDGEVDKLSEDMVLIPGMPVEAFIRTDDRTPLAYLVRPLTDYFTRAFREG